MSSNTALDLILRGKPFLPSDLPNLALWLDASRAGSVLTGGAGQFTAANSEYLSIADNAALSTANIDLWGSAWVYNDTKATDQPVMTKLNNSGSVAEYALAYVTSADRYRISMSPGTGVWSKTLNADNFGAVTVAVWNHLFWWYDVTAQTLNIRVNNGTPSSTAYTLGGGDTAQPFNIGNYGSGGTDFMNGRIANVCFGKSLPGGFATTPAATICSTLYNGGNGVDLRTIDSATKTLWGAVSAWPCNEISGTRSDVWSTSHLTDVNTVTSADGPYSYAARDADPVRQWIDASASANHVLQTLGVSKPLYKTAILNGRPVLRFDGSNDQLVSASLSADLQSLNYTYVAVCVTSNGTGGYPLMVGTGAADTSQALRLRDAGGSVPNLQVQAGYGGGGNDSLVGATNLGTTWHVLTLTREALMSLYVNGASDATPGTTGGHVTNYGATPKASVGSNTPGSSGFLNGDVAELLAYPRLLSGAELSKLHRYLGAKYAVAVA